MRAGPLTREPVANVKCVLVDAKLHEDAIHRGPAQIIPASRQAIQAGMLMAEDSLLEPYQKVFVQVPQLTMGGVITSYSIHYTKLYEGLKPEPALLTT